MLEDYFVIFMFFCLFLEFVVVDFLILDMFCWGEVLILEVVVIDFFVVLIWELLGLLFELLNGDIVLVFLVVFGVYDVVYICIVYGCVDIVVR